MLMASCPSPDREGGEQKNRSLRVVARLAKTAALVKHYARYTTHTHSLSKTYASDSIHVSPAGRVDVQVSLAAGTWQPTGSAPRSPWKIVQEVHGRANRDD